jgi:putative phosphoribosyl transferase
MDRFRDREQAGQRLAERLATYAGRSDVLVLALPRGGVPIAAEISKSLHAPMDVFIVRKLGVPGFEELAMGAVAMRGAKFIDPDVVEAFHISDEVIEQVVETERREMARREKEYRGDRPPLQVRDRVVILVDDGIATGSTMRVAIAALRQLGPARVIAATGVAPLSTSLLMSSIADEFISLLTPREFRAVGQFFERFPQLTDDDVRALLDRGRASKAESAA